MNDHTNTLRAAVLTASDACARGDREDASGALLAERLRGAGWTVIEQALLPDERPAIAAALRRFADELHVHVVLTTGGTGFSSRDVTPEATLDVIDRRAAGLVEGLRADGAGHTPKAWLSRAEAGLRGATLIINLPGSPKAVAENLDFLLPLLPHALSMIAGGGH